MSNFTDAARDLLFREARTANGFTSDPVSDELLREIWDLTKLGPTSANSLPLRAVFVRSAAARERLLTGVMGGNVEKTKSAPVTAILAYDAEFYEKLPQLFPHFDMRPHFVGNAEFANKTARDNAFLQIGYFILAARGLGLDVGPMAGFDAAKVDAEFFAGTTWKAVLLVNLGHADTSKTFPRSPRLSFDEFAKIV
jgi:3-hydroxypropanoate dehydrogenase